MARPRKDAPPVPPFRFTDGEIQALANMAWAAWESGSEHATTDRIGGVWRFLPERALTVLLLVERTYQGVREGFQVTGLELGVAEPRVMLASRIIALLEPAVAKRNAKPAAVL
jgi:hypothetical protein